MKNKVASAAVAIMLAFMACIEVEAQTGSYAGTEFHNSAHEAFLKNQEASRQFEMEQRVRCLEWMAQTRSNGLQPVPCN